MSTRLQADGREVYLSGNDVVLRTPGLEGEAELLPFDAIGSRSALANRLDSLAGAAGFGIDWVVAISDAHEVNLQTSGPSRSTYYGEPGIELEVPAPSVDWGQVLLHSDEAGFTTWHFPESGGVTAAHRAARNNLFVVPRAAVELGPGETSTSRGVIGQLGIRLLRVFSFKLVSMAGGYAGALAIRKIEASKRPYGVRSFSPEDFRRGEVGSAHEDPAFWQRISAGRSLLFIHGTMSRSDLAFKQLDPAIMAKLHQRYDGRLFAFNHPTLSADPQENVDWFLANLRSPVPLDLDIVSHSRGGLVARKLALGLAGRGQVKRLVFVAVPNAGTALTDVKYLRECIDVYTNILAFLPDSGVLDAFELVFEVVKEVASGTGAKLTGMQSMCPGGGFLTALNQGKPLTGTRCFALTADYEPNSPPGWKNWTVNRLMDAVFKTRNDLVVPTDGVFEGSGSGFPRFAEGDVRRFDREAAVAHTSFFGETAVHHTLLDWLPKPGGHD